MSTDAASPDHGEIGLFPGMTWDAYFSLVAVNHSTLEAYAPPRTPAHALYRLLRPSPSTPAQLAGQAVHCAILEPDRYEATYRVGPAVSRRTKAGQAEWDAFEQANPTAVILSAEDDRKYRAMRLSVQIDPTAGPLISGRGINELTAVWNDSSTGLRCKARLDRVAHVGGTSWVLDIKTARDASPRGFSRDMHAWGYHRQLAWYVDGLNLLRPAPRRAAFVVVESEPPHCVAVYELVRALEQGSRENERLLTLYAECERTERWPGYEPGIQIIDLPTWAVDELD